MEDNFQHSLSLRPKLIQLFEWNGMTLKNKETDLFLSYFKLLREGNKKLNLTSIIDFDEVLVKHFLDSIIPAHLIPKKSKVCDIGSGAGFPGIPIKIIREDLSITLVESTGKKVNFLEETISSLGLENIKVVPSRVELYGQSEGREKFDVVTARALAPLRILLEYALPLVKVGGIFIAYKGPNFSEEAASGNIAAKLLSAELVNTCEYSLNEQFKRTLAVYKKIGNTHTQYPREHRLIKKRPLG